MLKRQANGPEWDPDAPPAADKKEVQEKKLGGEEPFRRPDPQTQGAQPQEEGAEEEPAGGVAGARELTATVLAEEQPTHPLNRKGGICLLYTSPSPRD